jgi:hypothetical protein
LWADPETFSRAMKSGTQPMQGLVRKNPVSLKLGFSGKDWLRHRSRTLFLEIFEGSGNQGRKLMRDWRLYDHLRTDRDAPSRKPQTGTSPPVLASDGSDLAAAVQTIREIGAIDDLNSAVADAFPGARVEAVSSNGYFEFAMHQHGLLRPLPAASCLTGPCDTCCWSPRCYRRGRPR